MKTIALIGKGYWGSKILRYAERVFSVKYIAGRSSNIANILEDSQVEGVILATPIDTHYKLTMYALEAGKHVFVEKPVATRLSHALNVAMAASTYNKKVAVEYTQTFSSSVKQLVSHIQHIGRVYHVDMETQHLGRFTGYNVFWLLASHHISILGTIYPLGLYSSRKICSTVYDRTCTTGTIILTPRTSMVGAGRLPTVNVRVSLDYPGKTMRATFYGSEGTVVYNPLSQHSVVLTKFNRVRADSPAAITTREDMLTFDEQDNLIHSMEYFSQLMEGKEKSNIEMAVEVTRLIADAEEM